MKHAVPGHSPAPVCGAPTSTPANERLPPELLLQILGELWHDDLWLISTLSRRFRTLAYEAGLHIHMEVVWTPDNGFEGTLAAVERLLDHATCENPRLNIALTFRFDDDAQEWGAQFYRAISMLSAVLRRALPFLTGLHICGPTPPDCNLSALLCGESAPRLRELTLAHGLGSITPITHNLFRGDAPRLRKVWLDLSGTQSSTIDLQPVSAFQHVTQVALAVRHSEQQISISNMFPRAHTLHVFVDESASARVDVSGLDLWALEVHGGTRSLVPNSALASIPIVEHDHDTIDTFWPASRNELCACVEPMYSEAPIISFAPRSGIWRRSFVLDARGPGSPLPLADVHFLPKQLVSLTLTRQYVNAFVRVPLVLDALRELFLDLGNKDGYSWPSPSDAGVDALDAHLRCPKLESFVVFALGQGVTVCPERLGRLVRLIGIEAKPSGPTLTLAGCTFSPVTREGALKELFSFVDIVPSSDAHVPDYYETCRYEGQPAWVTMRD